MKPSRLLVGSLLLLLAVAMVNTTVFDRALAQEQPTKIPLDQPTKEPVQPEPTKPPVEVPPTKSPDVPTVAPPTKVPPTPLPPKEAWTSTPIVTLEPTKTPLGMLPTKTLSPTLPTTPSGAPTQNAGNGPTPLPGKATVSDSSTRGSGGGPSVGAIATPHHSTANDSASPMLIGVVFEDRNDNGVRDADEAGLPGVAVIVEAQGQQQVLVTDASGAYSAYADSHASARVVPPADWTTARVESVTLDRARNFPLRRREATAITPTVAASVVNFTSLALGGVGLGAMVWLGLLQHQRARVNSFNAWARADLRLRSESEHLARRDRMVVDEASIVTLLNQAGLDATGEQLGIDQVERLIFDPVPAIVGLGHDFQRLVFTPASEQIIRRLVKHHALSNVLGDSLHGIHVYPVDALNGDLFVTDDLAAAFGYLGSKLKLSSIQPMSLPQTERWFVYVVPRQRGKVAR